MLCAVSTTSPCSVNGILPAFAPCIPVCTQPHNKQDRQLSAKLALLGFMLAPVPMGVVLRLALMAVLVACTSAAKTAAPAATASQPTAANVMALGEAVPEITTAIRLISNNDDLAAYLSNPNTVCTFFAPTNAATTYSISSLRKFAGLAAQNSTLQNETFNYHVIPGRALTAADLSKMNDTVTRSGGTLYIFEQNGQPRVYSRPEYPVPLNMTNIKAGNCIVHTINLALVPPGALFLIQNWLDEAGTFPTPAPKQDWGPVRTPEQAQLLKVTEARLASGGQLDTTTSSPEARSLVANAGGATTPTSSAEAALRSAAMTVVTGMLSTLLALGALGV